MDYRSQVNGDRGFTSFDPIMADAHLKIGRRTVGPGFPPLVIAEIGINHEGRFEKAVRMIDDAFAAGCECVKFQSHVIEDEMIPEARKVIPGNAEENIWDIMARCRLSEEEEKRVKRYTESKGMIFLSTPFSRAAADRLAKMDLCAYKIGSGECNNHPLVRHIASFQKPVILSTGMNNIASIRPAVQILRDARIPFALMHCTSIYPTPYTKVRLGALGELAAHFPDAVIGCSDHSMGIYTALAAVPLGASLIEKHFTSDKTWEGPDVSMSIDLEGLKELITGSRAVYQALGGKKEILPEEQPTIDFAYASVVSIRPIANGERLTTDNIWVKRPGTGEIPASQYDLMLGSRACRDIPPDRALRRRDIC